MKPVSVFIVSISVIFGSNADAITPTPDHPTCTPAPATMTPTPPTPTQTCIPEYAYLERAMPDTCHPGDTVLVHLLFHGGSASIVEVLETVSEGWEILSPPWQYHEGNQYQWAYEIHEYSIRVPSDIPSGIYYFSGETCSYHWCLGYVYHSITGDQSIEVLPAYTSSSTPTITPTSPPRATVTETPPPQPTHTPSPEPPPCDPAGAFAWMKDMVLVPGDDFQLQIELCNPSGDSWVGYPVFLLLEYAGTCYFVPGFSPDEITYYLAAIPPGASFMDIFPMFTWPSHAGSGSAVWITAITNPEITEVIGPVGYLDFEWSE